MLACDAPVWMRQPSENITFGNVSKHFLRLSIALPLSHLSSNRKYWLFTLVDSPRLLCGSLSFMMNPLSDIGVGSSKSTRKKQDGSTKYQKRLQLTFLLCVVFSLSAYRWELEVFHVFKTPAYTVDTGPIWLATWMLRISLKILQCNGINIRINYHPKSARIPTSTGCRIGPPSRFFQAILRDLMVMALRQIIQRWSVFVSGCLGTRQTLWKKTLSLTPFKTMFYWFYFLEVCAPSCAWDVSDVEGPCWFKSRWS